MQADQRNARAVFLEIDPVHHAADIDMNVAADDRLNLPVHADLPETTGPRQREQVLEILKMAS